MYTQSDGTGSKQKAPSHVSFKLALKDLCQAANYSQPLLDLRGAVQYWFAMMHATLSEQTEEKHHGGHVILIIESHLKHKYKI